VPISPRLRIPAPSWYAPQVIDVLRTSSPFPSRITLDRNCLVYVRGHGPDGRYKDKYAERTLREWAITSANGRGKAGQCSLSSTMTRRAQPRGRCAKAHGIDRHRDAGVC